MLILKNKIYLVGLSNQECSPVLRVPVVLSEWLLHTDTRRTPTVVSAPLD
jgi:hypothetical protein